MGVDPGGAAAGGGGWAVPSFVDDLAPSHAPLGVDAVLHGIAFLPRVTRPHSGDPVVRMVLTEAWTSPRHIGRRDGLP